MTDLGLVAAEGLWTAALGELRLQMTQATFDTWVKNTQVVKWDDGGRVVLGCANAFTCDWLDNRLKLTVERVLQGIVGHPVRVSFTVMESSPGGDVVVGMMEEEVEEGIVAVRFYSFDPKGEGWLKTAKYDIKFWQPLVGCVAFATYQLLRCEERLNDGWGQWFTVTVEWIAVTLSVGRQEITGVKRKREDGGKYWQPGALDGLEAAGIAKVDRLGSGKKMSYRVSCLHNLPLLVPAQVETLPPTLQADHAAFLKGASLEYREWLQLELPSLVQS